MSQYKELADAVCPASPQPSDATRREIEAILRSLDEQEPVMVYHGGLTGNMEVFKMVQPGTKLYAAPVAAQPTEQKKCNLISDEDSCQATEIIRCLTCHRHVSGPCNTPAQPQQATSLSDAEILDLAIPFGAFEYGDSQGHKRLAFTRAAITAFCLKNGIKEQG